MRADLRTPPGRAGATWLRHRLAVAERGSDLLRQKLTMLVRDQDRLHRDRDLAAREWADTDRTARSLLSLAAALDGDRAVDVALDVPPLSVDPQWTTVMGVRYPTAPGVNLAVDPHPGRGPALVLAVDAYRAAATAAARSATATAAAAKVDAEVAAARQRVRALDRHWIPRLRTALATVNLQMAELETADTARRTRAVTRDRRCPRDRR